ncbi:sensitivity to high expression protein she9 [Maudiozyma exigua]|uniref:Sensitive to high expression protein 9, mitochondrial n=1 Tax=Maudiozyma exigua TaxID=34358 RepID=A0A9P6W9E7_MAUEX|nr:sensitivity to high expression protein she9 [Kazachstania exigua]
MLRFADSYKIPNLPKDSNKASGVHNKNDGSENYTAHKVWDMIEDRLKEYRGKYMNLQKKMDNYTAQFSSQVGIVRKSINEANKKIEEQEKETMDQKLNFKKDANTSQNITGLPSDREMHRKRWKRRLEFYLDSLQETIFTATRALNDVTGYSSIQTLRNTIVIMEKQLDNAKENLKICKNEYENAIESRATTQKQLNELLQRKSSWSPQELKQFTDLYQADATNSADEKTLKARLAQEEAKETRLEDELYRAILTRYHEEQIWSDKIRRTSTWGTFLLMGMNIILFLIFQLLLEPWKRRRLTRSFEDKVKTALDNYSKEQNENTLELLRQHNTLYDDDAINTISDTETRESTKSESAMIDKQLHARNVTMMVQEKRPYLILQNVQTLFGKLKKVLTLKDTQNINFTNVEFYVYSSCLLAIGSIVTVFLSGN